MIKSLLSLTAYFWPWLCSWLFLIWFTGIVKRIYFTRKSISNCNTLIEEKNGKKKCPRRQKRQAIISWDATNFQFDLSPKGKDFFCYFSQNIPSSPLSFISYNDCQIPVQRNFSGSQAYFYELLLTLIVSLESLSHVNICRSEEFPYDCG